MLFFIKLGAAYPQNLSQSGCQKAGPGSYGARWLYRHQIEFGDTIYPREVQRTVNGAFVFKFELAERVAVS